MTATIARDLKPCPFCGSPAQVEYDSGNENWNQKWWVKCTSAACGVSTRAFYGSNTWGGLGDLKAIDAKAQQDAKDFWNRGAGVSNA